MRHDDAHALLQEFVTTPLDERDPQVDAEVLAHVARCPVCAARLATLTRIDRSLLGASRDHHEVVEPTSSLHRRVLALPAIRDAAERRRAFRPRTIVALSSIALAFSLAIPVWLAHRDSRSTPNATRTLALHARNGTLSGSVRLGSSHGTTRTVRLMADGLTTGRTGNYSVWLTGPDGNILIRSFSANDQGGCDIEADAPEGHWSGIAITMNGRPPVAGAVLATATI